MSIYLYGSNADGVLGLSVDPKKRIEVADPRALEEFTATVTQTASGESHLVILSETGTVYTLGRGREGQLGVADAGTHSSVPRPVAALRAERIVRVAAGAKHSLAISADGKLYHFGLRHQFLRESDGSTNQSLFSENISLAGVNTEWKKKMIEKSHTRWYSGALTADELAEASKVQSFGRFVGVLQRTPICMYDNDDDPVVDATGGYCFTVFCTASGAVWAYGYNDKFQCGLGHRYNQETPVRVRMPVRDDGSLPHIVSVSAGQQHVLALDNEGRVYSWGLGVFGACGHGSTRDCPLPSEIYFEPTTTTSKDDEAPTRSQPRFSCIASGLHHSLALSVDGRLFSWGSSEYGQQGSTTVTAADWGTGERGSANHQTVPSHFDAFGADVELKSVSAGYLFNTALDSCGRVWQWGWLPPKGRLQLLPQLIGGALADERVLHVSAGSRHVVTITAQVEVPFALDFRTLVGATDYADLFFDVQGKIVPAHSCVVFNRCPRLRAMVVAARRWGHLSAEKPITVPGRHQVFLSLLHYLYTDRVRIAPHLLAELADLARRYQVPRLSELCLRRVRSPQSLVGMQQQQLVDQLESHVASVPSLATFGDEMASALDDASYADLKFVLEDGSMVHAHKAVLVRRSEFFRRLLEGNFRESQSGHITLPALNRHSYEMLVRHLYSGDPLEGADAVEALHVADVFLLDDLKEKLEHFLIENTSLENVCMLLQASDVCNAPRLRAHCMTIVAKEWRSLVASLREVSLPLSLLRELDQRLWNAGALGKAGELVRAVS